MLGGLARWLRICGYDAIYFRKVSDEELIERASEEGFVLLTRDRLLYRKAMRAGLVALLVEGGSEARSLASVSRRFNLDLNPECSRCPSCGASLRPEDKMALSDRVPPRTYEAYDDFWVCDSCGKVFWRGSHWRNIVETVEEACRLVRSPP
jgi:hypothetical protein